MNELKPFGDVPDKLSVQIKRSFVATRTYAQVLATGAEVLKKAMNVSVAIIVKYLPTNLFQADKLWKY